MAAPVLTPVVSSLPPNFGMGETYSWLTVKNDQNRPLYARAGYITNLSDISISLSASELNIGSVKIQDGDGNIVADVVSDEGNNALRVVTQDLEPTIDGVAIGDKNNNYVTVNSSTSSLNVDITNSVLPIAGPVVVTNTVSVTGEVGITNPSIPITYADSPNLDAFGRLRTSQPTTLIDTKHLYNKLPNIFDEVISGNASSSFVQHDSLVLMSTTNPDDYVIRQSWNHFNYEPGKSLQALFTFVAPKQLNSIKRIGLFQGLSAAPYEPSDGIFLEINGNDVYFKMVKDQGTNHSMAIPQSAWNVDKFDGTGKSGLTLDFNKSQIFTIDYEWLGVGRARLGFIFNGQIHYAHYENHYNNIEAPYLTSPNQPIRYELRQTGAGGAGSILKHICSTVLVEGGETGAGQSLTVATSAAVAIDSTSYKPIIFLRSNPNAHDATSYIKHLDFVNLGENAVHFVLMSLKNSNLVNTLNWINADSSSMQYVIGDTQSIDLSAGVNVYGGYISGSGQNKVTTETSSNIPAKIAQFGIGINGREEVFAIVGKSFGGNTTLLGVVNMIERT